MNRKLPLVALLACAFIGVLTTTQAISEQPAPSETAAVSVTSAGTGGGEDDVLTQRREALASVAYTDVDAADPWYDAVRFAGAEGLMEGMGGGQFDPEGLVTRAAVVTVLYRAGGEEAPTLVEACPDVAAGDWYAPAVAWAMGNGIITGRSDGTFSPNDPVTRAELAAILYRYAGHMGYSQKNSGSLAGFRDGTSVADYAVEPLAWAAGSGLYGGLVTDTLYPNLPVNRGQLAQVLAALVSHGTGDPLAREIVLAQRLERTASAARTHHADLQAQVEAAAQKYGAVGIQVAVIEHGVVTDTFATGWATRSQYAMTDESGKVTSWEGGDPMTANHKMRVASISKVAVGMAAMALRDDGVIDLDETIGTYWGCKVQNPYYPDKPVTVRNLLSHTSSVFLAGDDVSRKYSSVYARLSQGTGFSRVEPGSIYSWGYNNYGFAVLGMTLEQADRQVMDDILDQHFFDLLDIDAAFEPGNVADTDHLATLYNHGGSVARSVEAQKKLTLDPTPGATGQYFAGGLTISAADLGKLVSVLSNHGTYQGLRLLSEESVDLMESRSQTTVGDGFYQCLPLRYRTGIYGRDELYYHTGSAYGVYNCMSYDPNTGDGVVVLTTGASATKDEYGIYAVCGEISRAVYDAIT